MPIKETVSVAPSSAYRLMHPMRTVLVSCVGADNKPNIITLAWAMPVSMNPPLVALSIAPSRYSHKLIEETKEFVVNIPTIDMVNAVFFCGSTSGKIRDKFKDVGLTPMPARKVKAPIIGECVAHLECRLYSQFPVGDHTLFVGEVLEAYANRGALAGDVYDIGKTKLVFHVGGDSFATLESKILRPKI
ncbi:MAG: flavin reductase family protein [Candidatus Bathyarchaeia archaeon]|nr:flavin reductase family protein [Candidatus Bathyarchaeota archaeon]